MNHIYDPEMVRVAIGIRAKIALSSNFCSILLSSVTMVLWPAFGIWNLMSNYRPALVSYILIAAGLVIGVLFVVAVRQRVWLKDNIRQYNFTREEWRRW
jgi:hypothetical protein